MVLFNFTPDQKTAIEIAFQVMAARGWLTDEHAHIVTRYLLDLPLWTDQDEGREQAWLESLDFRRTRSDPCSC